MPVFNYKNNTLYAENVSISKLAKEYQTPLYIYSKTQITNNYNKFSQAFADKNHLICYAVKANSNIAVLSVLAKLGCGFDVVSVGEIRRVIAAGGDVAKCVFSGVAKSKDDIKTALELGIACFNVESEAELLRIAQISQSIAKIANISIRVNPDVDAKTHPYISTGLKDNKFGINITDVMNLYLYAQQNPNINIVGIDCHIGSQITELQPFLDALDKVLDLVKLLKQQGINLQHIDLGGGVGIAYKEGDNTIDINKYISAITAKTAGYKIILEPGRAIVGNAGVFITKVEFLKQTPTKAFAIIDGAMNDLLRPSLYNAYHQVLAVTPRIDGVTNNWDIVGPVCETGDFLAKDRQLNIQEGDYLALLSAGAYGFVMASNYNSRPKVAEVMVADDKHYLIRQRETIADIIKFEQILPND